jgi:transcriptional regulator with XRE-family HTH domain
MTTRFETKPGRFRDKGNVLWRARSRAGLSLADAARRLDLPILRLAALEHGDITFERDEAWAEAERILSQPEPRERI